MIEMKWTAGEGAVFSLAEGDPVPDMLEIHAPDGTEVRYRNLDGATEIRKGGKVLTLADSKDLTADETKPVTITDPPVNLTISVRPRQTAEAREI